MNQALSCVDAMRGQDNFRRRISITVGVVATVMVLAFSAVAGSLLTRSVGAAIDDDLRARAEQVQGLARSEGQIRPTMATELLAASNQQSLDLFYVQLLDPQGQIVVGGLPVSDHARDVAEGRETDCFEEFELDGRDIRVFSVMVDEELGGGALRIGTDVTNTYNSLDRSKFISALAAVISGLATAAITCMLGAHLVAPITKVSEAVNRISRDGELPDRLEGEGPDELGRLVGSFNGMLDDLRRSRAQQRQLVADASHELRTPLTRLRVKIEFVHTQPELPEADRRRLIEGAVTDLAQLGDLVSELLELAAEGTSAEQSQPLQLANVVSAEVERFRTTSGRAVDLSTTPGLVQTRPRQVARALTNLLVNADKYSPRGRPISVRQRGPQIEVRDQGPGIPPHERERVFDRFYRGTGHQAVDGSGLGLAIVESVARVNGGTTWIRDPDDGGPGAVVGFSIGPIPSLNREPSFRPRAIERRGP